MRPAKAPTAMLTHEDIQHLCGELPDWKVARILASEATYEDLKTAMTWAGDQDDIIGPAEQSTRWPSCLSLRDHHGR